MFAGMRAGVMDPIASHGSRSKHQPRWAAAKQEVLEGEKTLPGRGIF